MGFNHGIELSRDFVLAQVSEEEIFSTYFQPVTYKKEVTNPLRSDKHAGCKFYIDKRTGRIRFKDYAEGYNWDCFEAAQVATGQKTFKDTLRLIARDFGLLQEEGGERIHRAILTPIGLEQRKKEAERLTPITQKIQLLNAKLKYGWKDLKYWEQFGITQEILRRFQVHTFDSARWYREFLDGEIETKTIYLTKGELKYAYYLGKENWKLYFPSRSKGMMRFVQSEGTSLQGMHLLPKEGGEILIITKSYKDVMSLYRLGYFAVAPQAEGISIKRRTVEFLLRQFKYVFVLYDNDIPGMKALAKFIIENPEVHPLMFPAGTPKDVSDNIKEFGLTKVQENVQEAINRISIKNIL